jgi:hypothetical protein
MIKTPREKNYQPIGLAYCPLSAQISAKMVSIPRGTAVLLKFNQKKFKKSTEYLLNHQKFFSEVSSIHPYHF